MRHANVACLIVAATVSALCVPLASAKPRTVSFISVVNDYQQSGSYYTAGGDLYRGGTKVGAVRYACRFDTKQATCRGTIRATLSNGTLRLRYVYVSADPDRTTIKVIRGTGAYAGTRGTGTYTPLNRADSRQRIRLRLDSRSS